MMGVAHILALAIVRETVNFGVVSMSFDHPMAPNIAEMEGIEGKELEEGARGSVLERFTSVDCP